MSVPFLPTLIVFLGAGLAGIARHGINIFFMRLFPTASPLSPLPINIFGSFLMGCIVGWFTFRSSGSDQHVRLFLTTGILGGFTTFSTFTLEILLLTERSDWLAALLYIMLSVVLSIILGYVGLVIWR